MLQKDLGIPKVSFWRGGLEFQGWSLKAGKGGNVPGVLPFRFHKEHELLASCFPLRTPFRRPALKELPGFTLGFLVCLKDQRGDHAFLKNCRGF